MKKLIISLIFLSGCTMQGDLSEKDHNKIMVCTDMRDGEMFSFYTNTIKNVRVGILGAETKFDIITLDGKEKTLSANQEQWIKCEKRDN